MNHLEAVSAYWNTRSEGYRLQIEKEHREGHDKEYLSRFSTLAPGSKVLDAGCGPGYFSYLLTRLGMDVTAVDYSEKMLQQAGDFVRSETGKTLNAFKADVQNLPFPSECFDAVVSRNVIWNLDAPEEAYKEWLRVLKPGGKLFVYDGNHYAYLYRPEYEEVREKVEQTGNHILLGIKTNTIDEIAKELPLSRELRPEWDIKTLKKLDASNEESCVLKTAVTAEGKTIPINFGVFVTK